MSLKEELTDFCYRLIMTIAVALFLFLEIYNLYDPELITGKNIISVLLISFSFNVILLIYHKIHLYIFPSIFLVVAIFAFFLDENDVELILQSVLFKIVLICLAAFVVFLVSDTSVAVNLIISLGLIIYMLIFMFREMDIYPSSPALAVFYITFSVARAFRHSKIKNSARLRRYVTFLLPFLLIFPVMIYLLPKPEDPISWDWAKRIYYATVEKINEITHEISLKFFSSDSDGLSVDFGYDESMDYDNDNDDETSIMELYTDSRVYGNMYLKGEIFNVFEDGRWKNELETDKDYTDIDAFETYYGTLNFDRECVRDIVKSGNLKVKYLDLATSVVFMPAKIVNCSSLENDSDTVISPDNEHLLFNERKTYGTEYNVDYLQINYGSRPFNDYMNSVLTDDIEALNTTKVSYFNLPIKLEDLKEYRDYIKASYTSKPEVRDSVKNWVETVTAGSSTDYDKLKSIEYALSTFEYTLEDGQLPDYVETEGDFLNYFLIEKRKGYCVHYATAFCLLARYMGLPSRVIQGYKVRVEPKEATPAMSGDGHTWPEVYFEGKGWVAFEPTPGFGSDRYGSWKIHSGKYSEVTKEETEPYRYPIDEVPEVAEDEEYERIHTERRVSGMLILIIVSIIIISVILLLVTSLCINRIKRKRLSREKIYTLEFKAAVAVLRELKISREKGETLEEFSKRCGSMYEDLDVSFIGSYEAFLYGNDGVSDKAMKEMTGAREILLKRMKKAYGATYPIHRLRLYFTS